MEHAVVDERARIPWLQGALGLLLAAGAVVVVLQFVDPRRVWGILSDARPDMVALALGVVVVHYMAVGFRFAAFCQLFEIDVPEGVLVRTAVVSSALNRAVGFAGLVAYSIRIGVVRLWGGRPKDVVATLVLNQASQAVASTVLLLTGVGLVFGFPGLGWLPPPRALLSATGLAAMAALVGLLVLLTRAGGWVSVGVERLQELASAGRFGRGAQEVHEAVVHRSQQIRGRPGLLARPGFFLVLEPVTSLTVLYLAFWAVGWPLPVGHVILSYAAAGLVSLISIVPGGFGLREGSMAGVLVWVGEPWDAALAGVLLYRALLDWLPSLLLGPLLFTLRPPTDAPGPAG